MAKRPWKIGIATVLTLTFGGLVALSTGTLLFLSLSSTLDATRNTLADRLKVLIYEAADQSEQFYKPVEEQAGWIAENIVSGDVNPRNTTAFKTILNGALSTFPQIAAVSYQYPDGTGVFYDRKMDVLSDVTWPDNWQVRLNRSENNPQTRPPKDGIWVVRPSAIDGKPATTFIYPARTDDGDLGVVAFRIDLAQLSERLAINSSIGEHELVRFLLFNNRAVIGHPLLQMEKFETPPTIDMIDDPHLKLLNSAERFELTVVGEIPGVETFAIDTPDNSDRVFAIMRDDTRRSGGEITIGVHFDPQAGAAELNRLLNVAVVGAVVLLGSLLIAIFLGRRAAQPMRELANAAQLVQENKLEEIKPLPVGPVKELAASATAFNEMVTGLKERAKIRDLFGKYVPQNVAALLISDDATAEPQNAEATVLFLDIVQFSTLSEKMAPSAVVATMNAFFSEAVEIIEFEGGMVTQFQGDAILAVFNVPIPRDDHACAAVRAGISIIQAVSENKYEGQKLACRIGINTGSLVAGAIGAKDRLSYTVYGDAVNVAARLEELNKEYGTQMLVAGATAENSDVCKFVKIGSTAIRGRQEPVDIYTVEL